MLPCCSAGYMKMFANLAKSTSVKILIFVGILCGMYFRPVNGIFCWSCKDARSDKHCYRIGKWARCFVNQRCYVEQRFENGVQTHQRGCKQLTACESLVEQNEFECNPRLFKRIPGRPRAPIICRHCCNTNRCNPTESTRLTLNRFRNIPTAAFPTIKGATTTTRKTRTTPTTTVSTPAAAPGRYESAGFVGMSLGEVYHPAIGWIGLQRLDPNGRAPPPRADFPVNTNASEHLFNYIKPPLEAIQNRSEMRKHRRKEICTNQKDPLIRAPEQFNPKEECVAPVAPSCVKDGTFVFHIDKMVNGGSESSNGSPEEIQCQRTPAVDTVMVYDEEDHYVMIIRFRYRTESGLPSHDNGKMYVGNMRLIDLVGKKSIRRFPTGNG